MEKKNSGWSIMFYVFLLIFIAAAVSFVALIVKNQLDSGKYSDDQKKASSVIEQAIVDQTDISDDTVKNHDLETKKDNVKDKNKNLETLYKKNKDINSDYIGWLMIPETNINYPVALDSEQTNEYLTHDFYGNENHVGCLFQYTDLSSDYFVVYGHHMRNGTMFGGIKKYTDQTYWKEHPEIFYTIENKIYTYRIFAVFKTTADSDGFSYTQEDYDKDKEGFIKKVLSMSMYDCKITPDTDQQIIALSTCEYSKANGRMVILGVLE